MTIFAGIYATRPNAVLPDVAIEEIRKLVCRSPGHARYEFMSTTFFVAVVDMGAFRHRGIAKGQDGSFAAVVGDPVAKDSGRRRFSDRSGDVEYLRKTLNEGEHSALLDACGTFAGVHLHPNRQTLSLFVDKIGVRNLYVAVTPDLIIFATALRILQDMSIVPKRLDTASIIEQVAIHWPLGRKTSYRDIYLLGPAEIFVCNGSSNVSTTYWHWPNGATSPLSTRLEDYHHSFLSAIKARLTSGQPALACLTGGLDSRVVVGGLHELGVTTDTVNFSPPGTQDQFFARQFAVRIGSRHREVPFEQIAKSEQTWVAISNYMSSGAASAAARPGRGIWSGNGGSVGLGHVYMSETIVEHMRAGRAEDAIAAYMDEQGQGVTRRPLRRALFTQYVDSPRRALVAELEGIKADDPARAFYQFLMHNDQRRSLSEVYENIDLHGLEFVLPFFDSEFLTAVYRIPVEECIQHRFYNRWLRCFEEPVWNTPWQSYPGHVPCPIKAPPGLGYQFDRRFSPEWSRMIHERRLRRAKAMLASSRFPRDLISKPVIYLATVLCQMGSERLNYAIDKGYEYFRLAEKATLAR
jgi:asparagine synthetase B (glutamine-hydrolysing)